LRIKQFRVYDVICRLVRLAALHEQLLQFPTGSGRVSSGRVIRDSRAA
jgi:hypothetical protein